MSAARRGPVLVLFATLVIVAGGCGAAATPTPAPTPAPTTAPTPTPIDASAAFIEALTGTPTGRLPMTGTASFGEVEATLTGMLESSATDGSASTITVDIGGSKQTTESIRIGTQKWTREDAGVWVLDPEPADSTKSVRAYLTTLTTLDDRGVETKNGRELRHLVPPAGAELTPEAMGLDPTIEDAVIVVDFWADPVDGTPAIMSIGVSWNQPSGTSTVPVELAMDLDLTGLGTPATIVAPADAWTGFRSKRFGYSMAYAPGWSVEEQEGVDTYLLEGTPYIYVSPQALSAGYTLDRFHDDLVAYYETNDLKATPVADEEYAIDGTPARVLTYRFTNASGTAVFLVDAISVHDNTGWEIYLAQEQTGEEEARAFFDTMVSTFSFEE